MCYAIIGLKKYIPKKSGRQSNHLTLWKPGCGSLSWQHNKNVASHWQLSTFKLVVDIKTEIWIKYLVHCWINSVTKAGNVSPEY